MHIMNKSIHYKLGFVLSIHKGALGLEKKRHEVDFGCRLGWEIDF